MTVESEVAALDEAHFDDQAAAAAEDLRTIHHTFIELTPGDMTCYRISIVIDRWDRYWLATEFGPMYQMNPDITDTHWEYAAEHWLGDMRSSREWTARVLVRFMNTLRDKLRSS